MAGSSDDWTHVAVASTGVGANWRAIGSVLMVLARCELVLLQPNTRRNKHLVMGV